MEESAQNREKSKWYVLLGLVGLVIFGLSIYAGYRIGGEAGVAPTHKTEETSISKYDPPLVTPTIGAPRPVTLEIVSELDGIKLADEVDTAVLAEWWKIIGVDSEALPLKELGGYNWYTPTRLKIVLKDISPLSKEERWGLYKPTASGPEAEPVAGLATVIDATSPDEIEYQAYIAPEVLVEGRAVEEIAESVNRQVFEVLYEGAVGSTAMTPDDYRAKRELAFPPDGESSSVIQLKSSSSPAGGQGVLPNRLMDEATKWFLGKFEAIQHWQLVPQASAQTCGGNWKCGANWKECRCGNGDSCLESQDGQSCGSSRGTCNCNPICESVVGALETCHASYGVCKPPGTNGQCSQCLAWNTCYTNDQDDDTPPAGCGNAICSNGETCSTCPADCGACAEGRHVLVMLDKGVRELVLRADTLAWELRELPGSRRAA